MELIFSHDSKCNRIRNTTILLAIWGLDKVTQGDCTGNARQCGKSFAALFDDDIQSVCLMDIIKLILSLTTR